MFIVLHLEKLCENNVISHFKDWSVIMTYYKHSQSRKYNG